MQNYADYIFVEGGKERQDSLKNALALASGEFVMTADAARCCVDAECVKRVLGAKDKFDSVAPVTGVPDTTTLDGLYINRNNVRLIQTPQISKKICFWALSKSAVFTDDSGAMRKRRIFCRLCRRLQKTDKTDDKRGFGGAYLP